MRNAKRSEKPAAQNGPFSRRNALKIAAAGAFFSALPTQANALSGTQRDALAALVQSDVQFDQIVSLTVEPLAETGNSLPVRLSAGQTDIARWLLVAEKNPRPVVFDATLGPLASRSSLTTRIRLAATQNLLALAQTRDGVWHAAQKNVALTASACYDGT